MGLNFIEKNKKLKNSSSYSFIASDLRETDQLISIGQQFCLNTLYKIQLTVE